MSSGHLSTVALTVAYLVVRHGVRHLGPLVYKYERAEWCRQLFRAGGEAIHISQPVVMQLVEEGLTLIEKRPYVDFTK